MQRTIQYIEKELAGLYPKTEITGFIRLIFEAVCGMNFTEFILQKDKKIPAEHFVEIQTIVERLKKSEPIQYILGETEFYGLKLKVTPDVLIPRPETEELVQEITREKINSNPAILDIGTGSGCIALALKKMLPNAVVSGLDISKKALEIARLNAKRNGLKVDFFEADILNWGERQWHKYDVIVSNPPYVRESEKRQMEANVLHFEPEKALFVSDDEPLKFYQSILNFADKHLTKNGWLFFEINEVFGSEIEELMQEHGFTNIQVKKDTRGKYRMVQGKPG